MNCATTLNLINFCDLLALPLLSIFARPKTRTKATERTEIVIIIFNRPDMMTPLFIVSYLMTEFSNFKVYPTLN